MSKIDKKVTQEQWLLHRRKMAEYSAPRLAGVMRGHAGNMHLHHPLTAWLLIEAAERIMRAAGVGDGDDKPGIDY
jgi:hypothetical protein